MSNDPLQAHRHDNNTTVPSADPTITLHLPDGTRHALDLDRLARLPATTLPDHWIATDHGTHGPYQLAGVALIDVVRAYSAQPFDNVAVISADGYGNRVWAAELLQPAAAGPVLLCTHSNGAPLSRRHGLVRLVVPSERDNALRQIKWVATVSVNR